MDRTISVPFIALSLLILLGLCVFKSSSQSSVRDAFDDVVSKVNKVGASNCKVMHVSDLHLPENSISHVPVTRDLVRDPTFPNRTALLQLHNMALARAFYFSYILQTADDSDEPGLLYYYMSVVADVAANRFVNASSVYFSPNMSFTPSYRQFYNETMPLFAPRAYRADDFNDPIRLQRISTLNTIVVKDLGAVPNNSKSMNYSHEMYHINEWFTGWLPDKTKRQDSKITYSVKITHANGTNQTIVWHGPPDASDKVGPVKWTKPYYDCGRSEKWLIGASVPIPDRYPRHTDFIHIEYPTYVAVSVLEVDYTNLDINQCPLGEGNARPNAFAGTAKCKGRTTMCEPIHGFGLRRGGYQCRCKPGYRLPRVLRTPFLGEVIERAPSDLYEKFFDCESIGYMMVLTHNEEPLSEEIKFSYIEEEMKAFDSGNWTHSNRVDPNFVRRYIKQTVTKETCQRMAEEQPEMLKLPGDIAYGKELQLENEARMALRLAHFISSFLQNRKPNAAYAQYRLVDKPLSEDQMIGEVLSIVMGNRKVQGCGVFFDTNQFPNRTTFAPYAYRTQRNTRNYNVVEMTRRIRQNPKNTYLTKDWFQLLKTRWATDTDDLEEYIAKMHIRFNSSGEYSVKFDEYPLQYRAAELRHGYWTQPYFDCGGFHDDWIITYAAPFFGWDKIRNKLEFKGVVTTTMNLEDLDINQCPDEYNVNNAFKDTHKCDRKSTWCMPIFGRGFETGGYKCECRQGYEYPFRDYTTYFDGEIMEAEFSQLVADRSNRFNTLQCRIAGVTSIGPSILLIICLFFIIRRFRM